MRDSTENKITMAFIRHGETASNRRKSYLGWTDEPLSEDGCEMLLRNRKNYPAADLGRKISMERIHPHKFRRTMATRAIDKGMPIEQVQKILGHSQIDTTMQYAIVNQNNVKTSHRKYIA